MASKNEIRSGFEEIMDIPNKGLQQRAGFGLDIGGSMMKLVHATEEGSITRLHFTSYPRDNIEGLSAILRERIGDKISESTSVFTTGIGIQHVTEQLHTDFGIKIKNLLEMECFVNSLCYLVRVLPHDDLVYPASSKAQASTMQVLVQIQQTLAAMSQGNTITPEERVDQEPQSSDVASKQQEQPSNVEPRKIQYPVLLCILGSAGSYIKVNSDGTYEVLDGTTRCGKMFIALGKLITHAKNFEEILDLAAKGNYENVHVFGRHLKSNQPGDLYNSVADDMRLYDFGQDGDHSREDLAAAWLSSVACDIAQTCHLTAMAHDIRSLYLCGGFVGLSQLVREHIATWLDFRCTANPKRIRFNYYFLRHGGYYGALGALLKSLGAD